MCTAKNRPTEIWGDGFGGCLAYNIFIFEKNFYGAEKMETKIRLFFPDLLSVCP